MPPCRHAVVPSPPRPPPRAGPPYLSGGAANKLHRDKLSISGGVPGVCTSYPGPSLHGNLLRTQHVPGNQARTRGKPPKEDLALANSMPGRLSNDRLPPTPNGISMRGLVLSCRNETIALAVGALGTGRTPRRCLWAMPFRSALFHEHAPMVNLKQTKKMKRKGYKRQVVGPLFVHATWLALLNVAAAYSVQ